MPDKFNELLLKQDIIELYNAGITPDYGYLMNGRFEKDMIKTLYPLKTLSGNPISWEASDTEYLFPVISLEPKQSGTGDPSPDNVRPITGYDSVTVTQSKDEAQVKQIALTLPETIYGGTVDAVSGAGENTRKIFILKIADMNYSEDYPGWYNVEGLDQCVKLNFDGVIKGAISSISTIIRAHTKTSLKLYFDPHDLGGLNQSQMKELYPDLVVQLTLPLINPEPFQATGNQQLTSLTGYNTIYTNGDSMILNRKARRLEV